MPGTSAANIEIVAIMQCTGGHGDCKAFSVFPRGERL